MWNLPAVPPEEEAVVSPAAAEAAASPAAEVAATASNLRACT